MESVRVVLKPLPVLYACQGCPEFGQAAGELAAALDRRGLVEAVWLGAPAAAEARPGPRFPIFALDGCAKGCARRWLESRGVAPERCFVAGEAGELAAGIAA